MAAFARRPGPLHRLCEGARVGEPSSAFTVGTDEIGIAERTGRALPVILATRP